MTASQLMQSMPTSEEMALARESGRALSAYLQMRSQIQQIEILDEKVKPMRFVCLFLPYDCWLAY